MGELKYTHHAEQKFLVLKRHGFEVTVEQVEETVSHPDWVISQSGGRFIRAASRDKHTIFLQLRNADSLFSEIVVTENPTEILGWLEKIGVQLQWN